MKTFQNIDLSDSFLIEILVYFRLLLQSFFTYSVTLSTYCLGWKTFMKLDLVHAHLSKRLHFASLYSLQLELVKRRKMKTSLNMAAFTEISISCK